MGSDLLPYGAQYSGVQRYDSGYGVYGGSYPVSSYGSASPNYIAAVRNNAYQQATFSSAIKHFNTEVDMSRERDFYKAQLYTTKEGHSGRDKGGILGGLFGALAGAGVGAALPGPLKMIGVLGGAVAGGFAGLFGGAALGKKFGESDAITRDAGDDTYWNGSPLNSHFPGLSGNEGGHDVTSGAEAHRYNHPYYTGGMTGSSADYYGAGPLMGYEGTI